MIKTIGDLSDTFVNTCKICGSEYDQNIYEKDFAICEQCYHNPKIRSKSDFIKYIRDRKFSIRTGSIYVTSGKKKMFTVSCYVGSLRFYTGPIFYWIDTIYCGVGHEFSEYDREEFYKIKF